MKNNPYVGPRPYERQDQHNFYGRDREARQLRSLILSEREVLFYAESGAGKTSLLNAKVIPMLEDEGFHVLPLVRVGSELPPGVDSEAVDNIFVFNVLLTLAGEGADPHTLLQHTVRSFIEECFVEEDTQPGNEEILEDVKVQPLVLIVDQFEEIFTTHRDRWQDAERFFGQAREALDALPTLGVVFAMREDYVAAIDPYMSLFPRRLRARFRMERLGPKGALEAVKRPAESAGCRYDSGVAEQLVDDLRRIKAQRYRSTHETEGNGILGPFVEPVQLQVVCSQLWDHLPEQEDHAIQWEEVEEYGNIDRALTDFYEGALDEAMRASGVGERALRRWFGHQLITPMGTRGLVMREREETARLPNVAVDLLEGRHLIRADVRAGARWYELIHDRMIDPILASNQAWEAARETPLRAVSRRWQETGDASLLYRREVLAEAQAWARVNPEEVESYEMEFLEASQSAERARIQKRRRQLTVVSGAAAALVITALAIFGFRQYQIATAHRLVVQSQTTLDNTRDGYVRSLLLATESLDRVPSLAGNRAVRKGLNQLPETLATVRHGSTIWDVATSPNDMWVAMAADDGTTRIWDVDTGTQIAQTKHDEPVLAVTFSSDGRWMATASEDKTARVWDTITWKETAQMEHDDGVNAIALSPDNKWLATASVDGTVQVWETETSQEVVSMDSGPRQAPRVTVVPIRTTCDTLATERFTQTFGHRFEHLLARTVAFSPDGRWLAAAGNDNTVRLWDTTTWQETSQMEHDGAVLAMAFDPDSQWLATAGRDNAAHIWEVTTGRERTPSMEHPCDVRAVAFSPDGKLLATASDDQTAQVWEADTGAKVAQLRHSGAVWAVTFSNDGKWLATGGLDQTARLWELDTSHEVARMAHEGAVWALAFSPDSKRLVTAGEDTAANVWRVTRSETTPHISHAGTVVDVAFSPDGKWFATGSRDGTVRVWETAGAPQAIQTYHIESPVWDIAFSPDGKSLAIGASDGYVRVMRVAMGAIIAEMQQGEAFDVIYAVAFSHNGQWVASGSRRTARVWDAITGEELARMENEAPVRDVAFSPDDKWLATGDLGTYGTARVWDTATGEELVKFRHQGQVWDVAFSPNGKWLATASEDQTARLWDVASRRELVVDNERELIWWGHKGYVREVVFSPNGRLLAAASMDGTATVWNTIIRTRKPVAVMYHEGRQIWTVAFSPDSKWLATGGADGTARIWNISTGEEVFQVEHGNESGLLVNAVAFSPDGRWLATGSADRTARVSNWRSEDLIAEACDRLPWNLTRDEWRRYIGIGFYSPACPGLPIHPSSIDALVDAGRDLAREGDIEGAVAQFQKALDLDPGLDLNPEAEAARGLVERGEEIARAGDVEDAIAQFQRALELDPNLDLNPEAKTAQGLVERGEEIGRAGDVEDAVAQFQRALELDPDLDLDPETRAGQLAAPTLVERGEELARAGNVEDAIAQFQEALGLDPSLDLDPETETARGLVERGEQLARAGDVEDAVTQFQRALELDPDLDLDPETRAGQVAAPFQVLAGELRARQGLIDEAIAAYTKAQMLDPTLEIPADSWDTLCWGGSLWGYAADVMDACEQAVELAPDNGVYRDSRGLARALTGDYAGAIEDFKFLVEWSEETGEREYLRSERELWIAKLEAGQNPLDEETLESLRY